MNSIELRTSVATDLDWSHEWARSGAMSLTGRHGVRPLSVPHALVRTMVGTARRLAATTDQLGQAVEVDGCALLGERAALAALKRHGDVSCGGATRLLRAVDDWIAVSLARDSDVEMVPAWLEVAATPTVEDLWLELPALVGRRRASDLVTRATMLGMPVSRLDEVTPNGGPPAIATQLGERPPAISMSGMVVVDLSSMWAGPLCANLLGLAGARVIKVESERRPDGARRGSRPFFDLLHAGHESVVLDFTLPTDRRVLCALVAKADVVIEASRPRALAQLGVVAPVDGPRVWVSITGHGRSGPAADRVAFGDDAAVAGGLVAPDEHGLCFVADAVADPATGLVAASAVCDRLLAGGRWMIDVALSRTAAWMAGGPLTDAAAEPIATPRSRPVPGTAAALGEHTASVLGELGIDR